MPITLLNFVLYNPRLINPIHQLEPANYYYIYIYIYIYIKSCNFYYERIYMYIFTLKILKHCKRNTTVILIQRKVIIAKMTTFDIYIYIY